MFLLEEGLDWFGCGLGAGVSCIATETLGVVHRRCGAGRRRLGMCFSRFTILDLGGDTFSRDLPVTRFADIAELGVWRRRADRRIFDDISGVEECDIPRFCESNLARFLVDLRLPAGVVGGVPGC